MKEKVPPESTNDRGKLQNLGQIFSHNVQFLYEKGIPSIHSSSGHGTKSHPCSVLPPPLAIMICDGRISIQLDIFFPASLPPETGEYKRRISRLLTSPVDHTYTGGGNRPRWPKIHNSDPSVAFPHKNTKKQKKTNLALKDPGLQFSLSKGSENKSLKMSGDAPKIYLDAYYNLHYPPGKF